MGSLAGRCRRLTCVLWQPFHSLTLSVNGNSGALHPQTPAVREPDIPSTEAQVQQPSRDTHATPGRKPKTRNGAGERNAAKLLLRATCWLASSNLTHITAQQLQAEMDLSSFGTASKQLQVARKLLRRLDELGFLTTATVRRLGALCCGSAGPVCCAALCKGPLKPGHLRRPSYQP